MRVENITRVVTNELFKGYFQIPDWLSEKFEALQPIMAESANFCTIQYGLCRTTIYQPKNFGNGNLYQLIVKRKKLNNDRIVYACEWQEQAYQDNEGNFGEPPYVFEINVALHVLGPISADWEDIFVRGTDPKAEVPEDNNVKVTELREPFWRNAKQVAPNGHYEYNGYSVQIDAALLASDNPSGVYQIVYDTENYTFSITPTRAAVDTPPAALVEWIRSITGWCGEVNRWLGNKLGA